MDLSGLAKDATSLLERIRAMIGSRCASACSAREEPLRENEFGFWAVVLHAMRLHPGDATIIETGGLGDVERPAD